MTFVKILRSNQGMTLIEILIALTLLALAGTFITGKVLDQMKEGQVKACKIQMRNVIDRLREFKRHCGQYPTTEQGLEALVQKPTSGKECPRYAPGGYIEGNKVPQDPWDKDFVYQSPDGKEIKMLSYGADGEEGGEGYDADITSDNLDK